MAKRWWKSCFFGLLTLFFHRLPMPHPSFGGPVRLRWEKFELFAVFLSFYVDFLLYG